MVSLTTYIFCPFQAGLKGVLGQVSGKVTCNRITSSRSQDTGIQQQRAAKSRKTPNRKPKPGLWKAPRGSRCCSSKGYSQSISCHKIKSRLSHDLSCDNVFHGTHLAGRNIALLCCETSLKALQRSERYCTGCSVIKKIWCPCSSNLKHRNRDYMGVIQICGLWAYQIGSS